MQLLLWGWESEVHLPESQPSAGNDNNRCHPKQRLSEVLWNSHVLVVLLRCQSLSACPMFWSPLERQREKWNDCVEFNLASHIIPKDWIEKSRIIFTGQLSWGKIIWSWCVDVTVWYFIKGIQQMTIFFHSQTLRVTVTIFTFLSSIKAFMIWRKRKMNRPQTDPNTSPYTPHTHKGRKKPEGTWVWPMNNVKDDSASILHLYPHSSTFYGI